MHDEVWNCAKKTKAWVAVIAIATAAAASMSPAHAEQAQPKGLFKAMTDYLAAQTAISMDYDSYLEVVTTQGQKLGVASSGMLTLKHTYQRPASRLTVTVLIVASAGSLRCHLTFRSPMPCR